MNKELPKIIIIAGTNASGKSSLGIELAKRFHGEIISADSRQIYRNFDLCCGMVSEEEEKTVPHHLLKIKDIGEPFSAYEYQKMVYELIPPILSRGNVPFLVGGTSEYIRVVGEGYEMCDEPSDSELRKRLEKLSVDELQKMVDPEDKEKMNRSDFYNPRRLVRKIEKKMKGISTEDKKRARYNVLNIGVTWPKEILTQRIKERLDLRIEQGMIDEVKRYLDNGGSHEELIRLGLEYKYISNYLTGQFVSMEEFKMKLGQAINRFAKKQMTAFKENKSMNWLDMEADYYEQACSLITDFLGKTDD